MISIVEQFEVASDFTTINSGTSDNTKVVIEQGAIPIFVARLSSPTDDKYLQMHAGPFLIYLTVKMTKFKLLLKVFHVAGMLSYCCKSFFCIHPSPTVLIPALRMVGNIVTGDDRQTQYKDRNLLDYLKHYYIMSPLVGKRGNFIIMTYYISGNTSKLLGRPIYK
ncbi:hypothetical protein MKX03_019903 [Papaver bracteatum]|nr:hypothetical protein MKX03_019903 [Papaver bracteatum]